MSDHHHHSRILMIMAIVLLVLWMFLLVGCNTIPDKYQVRAEIKPCDTVYLFIHDTTYIIQEVSK